jgi:hypothetical protein
VYVRTFTCTYTCTAHVYVQVQHAGRYAGRRRGYGLGARGGVGCVRTVQSCSANGGRCGASYQGRVMVTTAGQASLLPSLKIHNPGAGRKLAHKYRYTCTVYVRTYVRTCVPLGHVYTVYFVIEEKLNFTAILPMVLSLHGTYVLRTTYVCETHVVLVRTFNNIMSQLSDWKRAHVCTEKHACFGRLHGSQLREGANAGRGGPAC